MSSWRDILVEWCNCLQMTSNIKDINELRGSDFFKNILSILEKSDIPTRTEAFFRVLAILSDTYQNAQIEEINCESFMALSEDRLIIITSLLMHYTCMYDGRDLFTLPLCQKLPKKSQLSIKDFLQNVNKEVTYSDLEKLIGNHRLHESNDSKPTQNPLTDVFRTPILKVKFEKDRAVTKLKNALELEQYQKADLEDDLESQIKKNQKLEKLLSKNKAEITALKSEIFNLRYQPSPQHSKNLDSEHKIKLLKLELENVEQYIIKNEKEHEQLRDEHQLYKKKVEEYEIAYLELSEKYLSYHEQIDELTGMLSDKSSRINHLETYCKELNEILEGYRQQSPVSTENSFSEYVPKNKSDTIVNPENLASTVIEIQLKESLELNTELMLQVNILNSELVSTKKYLDSKIEETKILRSRIKSESQNFKELKQLFCNMKNSFVVGSNEYKTSLSFLQKEVNNIVSLHTTSLDELDAKILTLQETIENNKTEFAELNLEKNKYIHDNELLTYRNIMLNTQSEQKIKLLESIIEQDKIEINQLISDRAMCVQDITNIKHQNDFLSARTETYCIKVTILEETIEKNRKQIEQLHSDKDECISKIKDLNNQNNSLNNKLEEYCVQVKSLEDEFEQYQVKCAELHSEKDRNIELNGVLVKKYEHILRKIQNDMSVIKGDFDEIKQCFMVEKSILYKLIRDLKRSNDYLLKIHSTHALELETELSEQKINNESLQKKVMDLENQLHNEISQLNQQIEHLEAESSELRISENENNLLSDKIIILQKTVDNLNLEKLNYIQLLEKQESKISELDHIILNFREEIVKLSLKNIHLDELVTEYRASQKGLDKYITFKEYMKQHICDLKVFQTKELNEFNNLILKIKDSFYLYINKLSVSEEVRETLLLELNKSKESNTYLLNSLEKAKAEMNDINEQWAKDKKANQKIIDENQALKDKFVGLTKTIHMFNDELNKIVKCLKERKIKSDSILNDIHTIYKEVDIGDLLTTPEKSRKTDDVSIEINNLGEKISKLNAYIDIFSEKERFFLKELETLKEELTASNSSRFDVIQNLKEQIMDNEHQISTQTENLHSVVERYNQLQIGNQKSLYDIEGYKKELEKIKKTHSAEIMLRESKIMDLEQKIHGLEDELANSKRIYDDTAEEKKKELVILENEKSKNSNEIDEYKIEIVSLEAKLAIFKEEISQLKKKANTTEEEYEMSLANLQVQVERNKLELSELKKKNEELVSENNNLFMQMKMLDNEKDQEMSIAMKLKTENCSLLKELEAYRELKENCNECEKVRIHKKILEEKHAQKIETLIKSKEIQINSYETFKRCYKEIKHVLDKLLSQKNILENLTNNMSLQISSLYKFFPSYNSKKLLEKNESLGIISNDIIKQYRRYSKEINDIVQDSVRYYENNCENIFASLELKIEDFLEKHNVHEIGYQISDLTERAVDILKEIRVLQKEYENSYEIEEKKENVLTTSKKINVDQMKEDDLKKKNLNLRQKVTLLEYTRSNLEKTVRRLREENKKDKDNGNKDVVLGNDIHYKMLLQEYISYKEVQEKVLKEYKSSIESLLKEYEDHKHNCMMTSIPVDNNFSLKPESENCLEMEKLREAYSKVRITNEKLENENILLKRIVAEQKEEMSKLNPIKEAHDKLLEENNKLMTEVDTMKYKRARDRDEFLRWLKKERSEHDSKNIKQIHNIKSEYEAKLDKMKDKMIKLYREEVNKEISKIKGKQHESTSLLKTVERLECELFEAKQRVQLMTEREIMKGKHEQDMFSQTRGSNSQIHDLDALSLGDFPLSCMNSTAIDSKPRHNIAKLMEFKHPSKVNPSSLDTRRQLNERQVRTLPRSGVIIEEVNIRRTSFGVPNSIGNLQMEDEEEMFNNKYLTDLKQGQCEAEDKDSRVSELTWRNSLVPPHLKSSYPAEMQFCSPDRFREDDIKGAAGLFDDSLCKLLPNDKKKKDFGTTSYKKPGPPTPSKNGGRLSLTGSETHNAKDQHSETKKSTPGRIRSLFTGKSSSRSSIEPCTSPKKRLSIFRR